MIYNSIVKKIHKILEQFPWQSPVIFAFAITYVRERLAPLCGDFSMNSSSFDGDEALNH
jgi:hypothetical protein